jgi:hypothetical protein
MIASIETLSIFASLSSSYSILQSPWDKYSTIIKASLYSIRIPSKQRCFIDLCSLIALIRAASPSEFT